MKESIKKQLDALEVFKASIMNHIRVADDICVSDDELKEYLEGRKDISFVLRECTGPISIGHITDTENIDSIMEQGFLIPSEEDDWNALYFGCGAYFCDMSNKVGYNDLKNYALAKYEGDIDDFSEDECVIAIMECICTGVYYKCVATDERVREAMGYIFITDTSTISEIKATELLHDEEYIKQIFAEKMNEKFL